MKCPATLLLAGLPSQVQALCGQNGGDQKFGTLDKTGSWSASRICQINTLCCCLLLASQAACRQFVRSESASHQSAERLYRLMGFLLAAALKPAATVQVSAMQLSAPSLSAQCSHVTMQSIGCMSTNRFVPSAGFPFCQWQAALMKRF